ncbi:radical SAM/SPASM domain-containing protein [Clostridium tyrobutyricum]|jgi:radical SAM protein with 4Fe4S-binding SPASM domain|uniref:radical SAM/SPASM peptide maturase WgkB n=1 Tax=Clostridium tyrobutyricum TaxID=1519 RepID=UPI00242A9BB0|nr:radical SAM protein [Clostridium tyrobutyricum]
MREVYSAPALVDINITNRCNLKCGYCSVSAGPNTSEDKELTVSDFEMLFKDLDDMKVHRISLSGGEPFVRKDFFEILEKTQKYKFAKVINTNGILITDDVARKLSKYNFDRICVTIDGSNPAVHESIRGQGTFKKSIEGIKNLQKYNLPVSTLFTLNKNNVEDLINTIKLNENLGIEYMSVMVICPTGRASKGDSLITKEKWYPMLYKLTKMKESGEIKLKFKIVPPNESSVFWLFYYPLEYYNRLDLLNVWRQDCNVYPEKRTISCQAGIKACSVNYNGDVYGCELMSDIHELKAGNIKEKSIKEIWNSSQAFNKLRSITFDNLNGKCVECDKKWCGAGCRAAAYHLDGSIYGSDNACFFHEED